MLRTRLRLAGFSDSDVEKINAIVVKLLCDWGFAPLSQEITGDN